MFKKLLSVFLVCAMLLVCCSCDKEEPKTALDLYLDALEKYNELTHYDITYEMNAKVTASGFSMDIPVNLDMKMIRNGNDIEFASCADMTVIGVNTQANVYFKDGVLYTDTAGVKTKAEASIDAALSESLDVENSLMELPEDVLKDVELKIVDNQKEFTVTFDGNVIKQELVDQLGTLDDMDIADPTFGDVTMTARFNKDGYIVYYALNFTLSVEMEVSGVNLSYDYDFSMSYTFNNIGESFTITYPDFSEFSSIVGF